MKKKLLAMILSAAMAATVLPGTAFAAELDPAASVVAEEELTEEEAVEEIQDDEEFSDLESAEEAVVDETEETEEIAEVEEVAANEAFETFSDDIFTYAIYESKGAVITGLAANDAAEITIPNSIIVSDNVYTVIGVAENALNSNASALAIPASVTEFGAQKLPALTTITVDGGNGTFFAQEGVLYAISEGTNRLVLYPAAAKAESFIIPANIGEIATGAFADASNLKTIVIGKDVKKIEAGAFASFINPVTIVFNTTEVPDVAAGAFYLDKAVGNVFYFTSASVLEAIQAKTPDFVESPFYYDPEGGEKLSDTTGIVAFVTDGLSDDILALLKANNVSVETNAAEQEEIVGASDISTVDAKIANGYYVISTKRDDNHYIHIRNDAMNNTGQVECNDSAQDAIVFKVTSEGSGKYRILSFWSNKRLGVNVSVPENNTVVTQRDIKTYDNQMWYIRKPLKDPDSGYVLLVNVANPKVVITASSNIDGGVLTVKESNASDSQLWKFNKISDPNLKIDQSNLYNIVSDADNKMALTIANKDNSTSYKIQATGKSGQRFYLESVGYGNIYKVINFDSEKTICVSGESKTPGADVVQFGTGVKNNQIWHLVKTTATDGTDAYYFKGVGSNLYMNLAGGKKTAGTNVEINKLSNASTQKWKFVTANIKATIPTGKQVSIVSRANKSLYLTVKGGSEVDNTNIDVEGKTSTTAQLWSIASLGDGYYKVINVSSRNSLSVKSGNTANGANICARPFHSTWNSQIWKIVPAGGDGSFYFINKHTGKYMTIKNGNYAAGTNIEQCSLRNDQSQKFYFVNGSVKAGWQKYGTTKRYYNSDLTYKKSTFVENGNIYLDDKGLPYTGFKKNGTYYYYYKGLNGKETQDCRPYLSKLFGTKKTWNGYTAPKCSYYITIDNASPCLLTVYTKYPGTNSYNLPVFAYLVSPGTTSTPTDYGNRLTRTKYRWKELMGPSWGQYATELLAYTRVAGSNYIDWTNNGEYFHSIACGYANDHNLNPGVYNLLGTRQSHGCVRMCVRYAWWTYTYVESGTSVKVGENLARPLSRKPQPRAWNSIDPTDPAYTGNYGYTDTQNWVYWNGYL
jgi:hypothetical protein